MAHLIDKDALVAEINRRMKHNQETPTFCASASYCEDEFILDIIKSLEMKEVDLEKAIEQSFIYHENHGDDFRSDKQIETAYRYGFKDGVKYKELTLSIIEDIEKQNLEIKEVNLDKKIKDYFEKQPIITRSEGVDYQLIPSIEDVAKHFFELGMQQSKK